MANVESSGHMRSKCLSLDFTLLFSIDPTIFSLVMSSTTMDQGFYLASLKLCESHSTPSNHTKSKLPNSGLSTSMKWHVISTVPSLLPQRTSQGPHSGSKAPSDLAPTTSSAVSSSLQVWPASGPCPSCSLCLELSPQTFRRLTLSLPSGPVKLLTSPNIQPTCHSV